MSAHLTQLPISRRNLGLAHSALTALTLLSASAAPVGATLPPLPPMPAIPAAQPVDSVPMADSKSAPEVKLDLPFTPGPYEPTWESIEKVYPGTPAWLREAKFGIWVHFGPQAAGKSTQVRITSLSTTANALGKPVKSVELLGYTGTLTWKQTPDALVVTLPDTSAFRTALGFKIETK